MAKGLARFEIPLYPTLPLRTVAVSPGGIVGSVLGIIAASLVALTDAGAFDVALVWCSVFGATLFVFHCINPPRIVLGVDGVLVPQLVRPVLIPWVSIQAVDAETPLGSRRKGSVLVLRLVGRQVARVRSSLAPVAMARVARVIAARLGATRPPVPTVLTQIESSRRAAEQLLASPQGLAYRDDGLPPEGWWKVLEGDWPLPHERVGAALALGSTQYLAQRQRAEEVLSSLASGPLRRLTRRAFAAHDAEQADRLLRLALQLGEMRPRRR